MPPVSRLGDAGSHGGVICTASTDTITNGRGTARRNDLYCCPIHGPNPIVTASQSVFVNGRGVVRIGDRTACGAVIVEGSTDTIAGG